MGAKRTQKPTPRKRTTKRAEAPARQMRAHHKRQAAFWDYDIPEEWTPKTEGGWIWYLERKLNHGDLKGLDPKIVRRYLPKLRLDEGNRLLFTHYFDGYRR